MVTLPASSRHADGSLRRLLRHVFSGAAKIQRKYSCFEAQLYSRIVCVHHFFKAPFPGLRGSGEMLTTVLSIQISRFTIPSRARQVLVRLLERSAPCHRIFLGGPRITSLHSPQGLPRDRGQLMVLKADACRFGISPDLQVHSYLPNVKFCRLKML